MCLILLSPDLTIQSAVQGGARRLGLKLSVCMSVDRLFEKVAEEEPALGVILDLKTPGLDVREVVARLRENHPPRRLIAFGPHVHEHLLESARQAGCDLVLTRGQFHRQLTEVLGGLPGD